MNYHSLLFQDPWNMHRTVSNKTTLVWEMTIPDQENFFMVTELGKTLISLSQYEICEELAFPYLFPKSKFGKYSFKRLSVVWLLDQILLHFNQNFAAINKLEDGQN